MAFLCDTNIVVDLWPSWCVGVHVSEQKLQGDLLSTMVQSEHDYRLLPFGVGSIDRTLFFRRRYDVRVESRSC